MESVSDIEIAVFWMAHIDYPCGVVVNGVREDLRDSYIIFVERQVVPTISNPWARSLLEDTIKKYK